MSLEVRISEFDHSFQDWLKDMGVMEEGKRVAGYYRLRVGKTVASSQDKEGIAAAQVI